MADRKKTSTAVEGVEQHPDSPLVAAVEDPAPAADTPRTYTAERLIAEAQDFLGVPVHVVAGAFHGQKEDNWTIDEATTRVNQWLQQEV